MKGVQNTEVQEFRMNLTIKGWGFKKEPIVISDVAHYTGKNIYHL